MPHNRYVFCVASNIKTCAAKSSIILRHLQEVRLNPIIRISANIMDMPCRKHSLKMTYGTINLSSGQNTLSAYGTDVTRAHVYMPKFSNQRHMQPHHLQHSLICIICDKPNAWDDSACIANAKMGPLKIDHVIFTQNPAAMFGFRTRDHDFATVFLTKLRHHRPLYLVSDNSIYYLIKRIQNLKILLPPLQGKGCCFRRQTSFRSWFERRQNGGGNRLSNHIIFYKTCILQSVSRTSMNEAVWLVL